jgi:predicted dehydrogenase
MGKQYVKALRALGVQHIRVCSRSHGPLEELRGTTGLEAVAGGFERLQCCPKLNELGIIATPTASLIAAAERLASLGFRRLLIEKPVSLRSREIEQLAETLERKGVEAACAYNRVAYPSFHEVLERTSREGGVTSCTYTFTEMIRPDWTERFPPEELARWGIANSLHPISMAHGLVGLPATWSGHRTGAIPWHSSAASFVGSGISERGIPFAYHADWGSKGRWSVEVHTASSSYRLCPLEKVFRKTSATGEWEEVRLGVFNPDIKAGFVEELAAMLDGHIGRLVPLVSLREALALTQYTEQVFGYDRA